MARKLNPWLVLVKQHYDKVLAEGKLKGAAALQEAMKRARKVYVKEKKHSPVRTQVLSEKTKSQETKEVNLEDVEGHGAGKVPFGSPSGAKRVLPSFQDLT